MASLHAKLRRKLYSAQVKELRQTFPTGLEPISILHQSSVVQVGTSSQPSSNSFGISPFRTPSPTNSSIEKEAIEEETRECSKRISARSIESGCGDENPIAVSLSCARVDIYKGRRSLKILIFFSS